MSRRDTESYGQQGVSWVDRFGVWLSQRAIRRWLPAGPGLRVLELGCGYRATQLMALRDRWQEGTGVDFKIAPELRATPGLAVHEGPIEATLPKLAAGAFDVVLLISVLEHLPEPGAALAAARRLLRPGGVLLVNVPTWRGKSFLEFSAFRLGLSPRVEMDDHKMYYDKRDLWPLLVRAGFRPSEIRLDYHKFGLNLFGDRARGPHDAPGMNLLGFVRSLLPLELKIPRNPLPRILTATGYFRLRTRLANQGAPVRDLDLYRPLFAPWEGEAGFKRLYDPVRAHTLVSPERCWILLHLMRHALALPGAFAEFGVFRGGTALLAAGVLRDARDARALHLFDSFAGMPATSAGEPFAKGDFGQTSEAAVRALVAPAGANAVFHAGYIPDTFQGVEIPRLAFAHVDVDLYQSVLDCIEFVYPRLVPGGVAVFDDYGFPSCSRAREAADLAFAGRREKPIYLPTGQAMVIKLPWQPGGLCH